MKIAENLMAVERATLYSTCNYLLDDQCLLNYKKTIT